MENADLEQIRARLAASADRLTKFLKFNAPASVICTEIAMAFKFATVLFGNKAGEALGDSLTGTLRNAWGLCAKCGGGKADTDTYCAECNLLAEMKFGGHDATKHL